MIVYIHHYHNMAFLLLLGPHLDILLSIMVVTIVHLVASYYYLVLLVLQLLASCYFLVLLVLLLVVPWRLLQQGR